MAEPVPLPIACTLTGATLEERAVWLRRLGEAALIDGARDGNRLDLRFRSEAEADVTGPLEAGPVLDDMLAALRGAYR